MFARLADRLVLMPSRHPIDPGGKKRRMIPFQDGHLEAWTLTTGDEADARPADLFILKFSGNASRAELTTEHPAEMWPDLKCEVWSINKPGYGGSSGRASLRGLPAAAEAAFEAVLAEADGRPIIVAGNSIGTTLALYLAARHQIAGLLLRNPVPLAELIYERYGWWNLYLGSALVARQVPSELDTVSNAAKCTAPALFLQSGADTLVPPAFQQRIIEAYAGEKQCFVIEGAEHHTPLTEADMDTYQQHTDWLRGQSGLASVAKSQDAAHRSAV